MRTSAKNIPKAEPKGPKAGVIPRPTLPEKKEYKYEITDASGRKSIVHDIAPKFDQHGTYIPPPQRGKTAQDGTNLAIESLVTEHGEQHRRLITDVLHFLRTRESQWGLPGLINRPNLIDHLLGKSKPAPKTTKRKT